MKQSKRCPKCHSLRVGYIAQLPDVTVPVSADGVPAHGAKEVPARAAGVGPVVDTGILRYGRVSQLVGSLEAYVCADCGLYETYVREPGMVSWEDIRDFHWVNEPVKSGPYR